MAAAADLKGEDERVIAVVGDGSLGCGIALEALNNITAKNRNLIIVLNDNAMSISKTVGALSNYLRDLRLKKRNNGCSIQFQTVPHHNNHNGTIRRFFPETGNTSDSPFSSGTLFEDLGLWYTGPVDGHDLHALITVFNKVKKLQRPVVVHTVTQKGRGYDLAERAPGKFHSFSGSHNNKKGSAGKPPPLTFSSVFGTSLCQLAEEHDDVIGITAAMCAGTGLQKFAHDFPNRFYDVGIAEEHAVVFAAGLAANGLCPVVAVYASFLQRAYDCIFHDVCLQNLPVIFCTDRSGIVDDGPTHHGIQDLAFLRTMPNLDILAPRDERELRDMLFEVYRRRRAAVIRYPRGGTGTYTDLKDFQPETIPWGVPDCVRHGNDLSIWALGPEVRTALDVAELLQAHSGIEANVINTRFFKPFPAPVLRKQAVKMPVITIEDAQVRGGLGSTVDECLVNENHHGVMHFGWGEGIVPHGTVKGIRETTGMTAEAIAEAYLQSLE
jgi:1-deoxy-D-xylulose-5-phosphate synthase